VSGSDPLPHQLAQNRGKYNLPESLLSMLGFPGNTRPGTHPPVGLVREVSDEIAHRSGRYARGVFVPLDLILPERRALTATTGAGAIRSVFEELAYIDVLRAKMVAGLAGARITTLSLDTGKVVLPRRSTTTQVSWVGDGVAPGAQSNVGVDQVLFNEHTVEAYTDVTAKMLASSFADLTAWVLDDVARAIGVEVDRVALSGAGDGGAGTGESLGLLNNTAVPVTALGTNGGAPTRNALIGIEKTVGNNLGDASQDVSLAWVTTPNGRSTLRQLDGATGNAGRWVWADDNTVLGSPAYATANVPSTLTKGTGTSLSGLLYGNWRDLIVNMFTAVDLLVNPYQWSTTGFVRLQAFLDVDVQAAQPLAFARVVDMVTN
jgi:HK97 family phage major capsid protein